MFSYPILWYEGYRPIELLPYILQLKGGVIHNSSILNGTLNTNPFPSQLTRYVAHSLLVNHSL